MDIEICHKGVIESKTGLFYGQKTEEQTFVKKRIEKMKVTEEWRQGKQKNCNEYPKNRRKKEGEQREKKYREREREKRKRERERKRERV